MLELGAFPLLDRIEVEPNEPGRPDDVHVVDPHASLPHRCHGELRLERHAQLPDDDDVQRRTEVTGDLERHGHATARKSEDDGIGGTEAGPAHHAGQETTGLFPIAKPHAHLPGVTRSVSSTRIPGKCRSRRRPGGDRSGTSGHRPRVRGWGEPDGRLETSGRGMHVEVPGHLNSHQRDTLAHIFQHPLSHNLEWHSVLSLLQAVGTVHETHKSHVLVTIGGETETLEPPHHKDIEPEQLAALRRLLRRAGYGPEEMPA